MSGDPWEKFRSDVTNVLKKAFEELNWPDKEIEASLEEPPDPSLGDLATTVCFELPKELKESPQDLSKRLAGKAEDQGLIEEIEAEGGYVNFFVDENSLTSMTIKEIIESGTEYGHIDDNGKKTIIEHTSVNPTKPLHVGHARNAIIGDTMGRVLKARGHEVEVQNYIDDLGLQVAQTLTGWERESSEGKFDHYLGKLYVDFHEKAENDPALEEEARTVLSELESGEGELAEKAREMTSRCVKSNLETSDDLNIDYDLLVWESDITRTGMLDQTLNRLKKTPYLVEGEGKQEGALVLKLEDFGLEDKVIIRSDGTAVYTARDLAYQLWKFGEVDIDLLFERHSSRPTGTETYTTSPEGEPESRFGGADQVINVIGVEQKYTQNVVFSALKILGLDEEYENSHHLAYEHVRLPSKKFKGREGTWIGYSVDDVLEETVSRARKEVEKRNPEADDKFVKEAARAVAVGAVRYSLVRSSPEKEVVFKWDEALDFERNSGPAIQYSHARACSILRKGEDKDLEYSPEVFKKDKEYRLVKKLSKFPQIVKKSCNQLQPHLLATYASELALLFNKFYEVAPVLKAESEELRQARYDLVKCTKKVLENSLKLLGIKAPERM